MDKNPKRNRDKCNPYYLSSDKKNNTYIVTISSEDITEDIKVEITKEVFDLMDELEKDEAKLIQRDKRHLNSNIYLIEHDDESFTQEEIMEVFFYKRAKDKPKSLEDKVIEKIENEKLYKALNLLSDMHRRRILLYFKHNLSFSQIAEIEGCSKMAVKYSIDNALKELQKNFFKKS